MIRPNFLGVMSKLGVLLVAVGAFTTQATAQDDQADDGHHFHHNHLAMFVGGVTPFTKQAGETSFVLGADYERRFNPAVGVIALADFAFGQHKRTALFAAKLSYRPMAALRLAAGPGFELVETDVMSGGTTTTKHKAYFVIATRANYEFHVGKLSLGPTVGLDFIGETKTNFVFGVSLGYGF